MKTFNKFLVLLASVFLTCSAQAEVWQARYGVAETFNFKLYNADGTLDVDEADGGTEVSLSCNEGAETTATNDFVDEGTFYSIALTSGETSCERVAVVVAATTTEVFFIQTVDSASAMVPTIVQTGDSYARIGAAGAGLTNIDLPNQTMDIAGTLTTVSNVTNIVTANTTQISSDSTAADNLELAFDGTLTGSRIFGVERAAFTAQSATGTTLVLDSAAAYGDNTLTGQTVMACGSTQGYCQSLSVASNVGSTDTLTLDGTWPVTPSGTITGYLFATAPGSGTGASAADVWAYSTRTLTALDEDGTTIDLNASYVGGLTTLDEDLTTLDLNATAVGSVAGAVASVTGLTASDVGAIKTKTDFLPSATAGAAGGVFIAGTNAATTVTTALTTTFTGNLTGDVGGNVTGTVGTVNALAANSITAAATATDFTTEITSGLATASALTTVSGKVDAVDTEVAAVKAVTDKLDTALVLDGAVYQYTVNALENGPSGSGSSPAAIADEVQTRTIAAVTVVNGLAANTITAAATASDFTTEVTSNVSTSSAVSTLQTSVDAVPTNAELAIALGTADDAVLAAVTALNNLSPAQVRDLIIDDQGAVTLGCALATILAVNAGDVTTSSGNSTFKDASNAETRVTSVVVSAGNRSASLTCPSY